jgi:hypothetical protein
VVTVFAGSVPESQIAKLKVGFRSAANIAVMLSANHSRRAGVKRIPIFRRVVKGNRPFRKTKSYTE